MPDIKPVSNYGAIASLAIDLGCGSLGELLVTLALYGLHPDTAAIATMRRVFVEYAQTKAKPIVSIISKN